MPDPAPAVVATPTQDTPNAAAKATAEKPVAPAKETLVVPAATPAPSKVEASKGDAAPEVKPAEGSKPKEEKPAAPETLELKLPEDSLLDADYAKELGLDQKRAESLAERMKADRASFIEDQKAALEKKADEWVGTVKADKEIGGENFPKAVELAKRFVSRYGSDELKKALNDTGLGNHPELVRIFYRAGKSMQDDSLVVPNTQPGARQKTAEEIMFPTEELQPKEQPE